MGLGDFLKLQPMEVSSHTSSGPRETHRLCADQQLIHLDLPRSDLPVHPKERVGRRPRRPLPIRRLDNGLGKRIKVRERTKLVHSHQFGTELGRIVERRLDFRGVAVTVLESERWRTGIVED